ncbi:MAG: (2Fe-2S) ferredoxin domain-containing protein [Candidatus Neomarinimicrobiota bacterium]
MNRELLFPTYEQHIFFVPISARPVIPEAVARQGLKGRVRANKTGCLNACELGVAVVIYPQGVWYLGVTPGDVDEIFATSIEGDGIVQRLVAGDVSWERLARLRCLPEK